MAGPWEDYGGKSDAAGPWDDFKSASTQTVPTAPQAPTENENRWDVPGDIGRAMSGAVHAVGQDLNDIFSQPTKEDAEKAKSQGFWQGQTSELGRQLSGLRATASLPFDVMGAAASPVVGALHGTVGSALSYLPGEDKQHADKAIDAALSAVRAPEGVGGFLFSPEEKASIASDKLHNEAASKITSRAAKDNLTPTQIGQALATGGGKLSVMDTSGNLQRLAKNIVDAGDVAADRLKNFIDTRLQDAGPQLKKSLEGISGGSTYDTLQKLFQSRSQSAAPLYEKAFASGSTAPFEKQYENEFNNIITSEQQANAELQRAQQGHTLLQAKNATDSNVYSKPTPEELSNSQQAVEAAQNKLNEVRKGKEQALSVLRQAQEDRTANAPGAVWSPRIQQFLADPDVQAGIRRGLRIEKKNAITENRPFQDRDYAITGRDENGDPVVGAVPTMKMLATANEGLNSIILDQVHPVGHTSAGRPTKEGVANRRLQKAFEGELRRLNPTYGQALDQWSGDSASIDALREGSEHFKRGDTDQQVQAEFSQLSPSNQDLYRMGAAQAKLDQLHSAPSASEKSSRLVNTDKDAARFRMLFQSPEEAQKFFNTLATQKQIFESSKRIAPKTLPADEEDKNVGEDAKKILHAIHGLAHASRGNIAGVLSRVSALRDLGVKGNPEMNSRLVDLLTSNNVQDLAEKLLQQPQAPGRTPTASEAIQAALTGTSLNNTPQGNGNVQ